MKRVNRQVNVLWAIVPTVLFIVMSVLSYRYVTYTENTIKPYARAQNKTIGEFAIKLQEANYNTTYNAVYMLEQLKGVVQVDNPAAQKQAFDNIINFKSKQSVMPPVPPKHLEL